MPLIRLLLARLERISADSYWAHRASGVRGSLIQAIEQLEKGRPVKQKEIMRLITLGFKILEEAAREKV